MDFKNTTIEEQNIHKFYNWHFTDDDLKLVIGINKGSAPRTLIRTKSYEEFRDTVIKYNGAYNLYTVVNKISDNNIEKSSNQTVINAEIVKYRTLYIDVDPVRKLSRPGFSYAADNEESRRAYNVTNQIRDYLKEYGFPEPLVCFTGNGYSLDYPLNLEVEPEQVRVQYVEPVIAILKIKFGSVEGSGVDIDSSVVNEARLRRIPGSINIKGYWDEEFAKQYPERCRRYSTVESLPVKKELVTENLLNMFIDDHKALLNEAMAGKSQNTMMWPSVIVDGMGRHKILVKFAGYLRGVCNMDEPEIFEVLKTYNETHIVPKKTEDELRTIARDICRYEKGNGLQNIWDIIIDETYITMCVAHTYKDVLRYNVDFKKWMCWNERYWELDDTGEVIRRIEQVIQDEILKFTSIALSPNVTDVQRARILGGEKGGRIRSSIVGSLRKFNTITLMEKIEKRLRIFEGMYIRNDECNANKFAINLKNGVFDLATRQLKPHNECKEYYMTFMFNAEYDPEAKCPIFDKFINEIMLGDPDMVKLLLKIYGYCLSGDTSYEKFFVFKGAGGNGKSVLGESLLNIFGSYGQSTSYEAWISTNTKNWELSQLPGKRYINCSEVPPQCRLNTPLIKRFVSGDTVLAEAKFHPPFSFLPQGKLIFQVNHMPYINDLSNATMRRLVVVPFDFVPETKDIYLKAKIIAEANGVLNRLIEGYYMLMDEGFELPAAVLAENKDITHDMDWLLAFLDSECVEDKSWRESNEAIYNRYKAWAEQNNENTERSIRAVLKALREKGFKKSRDARTGYILGIRLKQATKAALKIQTAEEFREKVRRVMERETMLEV